MGKEEKKYKSLLAWYDVIKIAIALILAYIGISGVVFFAEKCERWIEYIVRTEETESKGNRLVSNITISDSHIIREDSISNYNYGYCVMANAEGKFGVIDSAGIWVIQPEYVGVTLCKEYAIAKMNKGFNMQIDYSGHVLSRYVFDDVTRLWYDSRTDWENIEHRKNTAYCMYTVNGRCGLMDIKGTILTEPIYTNIIAIDKELFLAKLLDGCSHVLIDGKGEVISR
mgnify:CR=1 FL=1